MNDRLGDSNNYKHQPPLFDDKEPMGIMVLHTKPIPALYQEDIFPFIGESAAQTMERTKIEVCFLNGFQSCFTRLRPDQK